jgi:hypothetical protein
MFLFVLKICTLRVIFHSSGTCNSFYRFGEANSANNHCHMLQTLSDDKGHNNITCVQLASIRTRVRALLVDTTIEFLELQLSAYSYPIERRVGFHIFSFPTNLSASEGQERCA